ncbi:SDR family NAD(P)-dependent oxidoreductase [Pelagibacterium lacus]|uniref:SDR family NAD(P)-dependent oxidoreductase n=1 Tax=Pelagibacterium lacus TaxID=2282655 RepID=A0A369W2H2_9HYPH|nr:SDR family oxidoreductase [Pelagibacterium lacus]RDE08876.1 SDR family NAD(P)-dependent oxidoreductase [Pelagibacterium lacus]
MPASRSRKVIVITGAGSGIGAATARRLAAENTALLLHTRGNRHGLEAVAAECRALGAEVALHLGDLAAPETAASVIDAARDSFGAVDVLVSNAGVAHKSRFGEMTEAELRAAFEIIPLAFFRLVEAALPDLLASPGGRVIAISSFVAHAYGTGDMLFPASSAAKAALEALAKALAVQLGPDDVTVNCVAPGFTRKDTGGHTATSPKAMDRTAAITPTGRVAEPIDIAEAVAYLASPGARQVTGQILHVDGGLLLP